MVMIHDTHALNSEPIRHVKQLNKQVFKELVEIINHVYSSNINHSDWYNDFSDVDDQCVRRAINLWQATQVQAPQLDQLLALTKTIRIIRNKK